MWAISGSDLIIGKNDENDGAPLDHGENTENFIVYNTSKIKL